MRLTSHTDYALRVLMALSMSTDRFVSVAVLAERFGVSMTHLQKVVQHLVHTGWISSARGRGGGVRLAMSPSEIRIGAVVRSIEPDFALVACLSAEGTCPLAAGCGLQAAICEARSAFFAVLDGHTLASVADSARSPALLRLMGAAAAP